MATLTRHVHLQFDVRVDPIDAVAPDLQIRDTDDPETVPVAIVFTDEGGDTHVYVVTDEVRQQLTRALHGGVILPSAAAV